MSVLYPLEWTKMSDYCERSVFEALANILIHRNYLINVSEVHIDIFDDCFVIHSLGGMLDGTQMKERGINDITSTRRNLNLDNGVYRIKIQYVNMNLCCSDKG